MRISEFAISWSDGEAGRTPWDFAFIGANVIIFPRVKNIPHCIFLPGLVNYQGRICFCCMFTCKLQQSADEFQF